MLRSVALGLLLASRPWGPSAAAEVDEDSITAALAQRECEATSLEVEQCGVSLRQLRGELRQSQPALAPAPLPAVVALPEPFPPLAGPEAEVLKNQQGEWGPKIDIKALPVVHLRGDETPSSVSHPPFTDPSLLRPSSSPLYTFYMYRALSDESYPQININAGNLAGVLWYLHHEVVVQAPRKFNIKKIIRFKVQMRATEPLLQSSMHFGIRMAFDRGQATGPFVCGRENATSSTPAPKFCMGDYDPKYLQEITPFSGQNYTGPMEWQKYGFNVGCNALGYFPFPTEPVAYPGAVWYSLPGPCPSQPFDKKDDSCLASEPGGYCKDKTPTGAGDCTWNYNFTGESITVDELVGISSYDAFVSSGKREYDPYTDKGISFSFWDDIKSEPRNLDRVKVAQALFAAKYPLSPKDEDLQAPPCDFSFPRFYRDYTMRDPNTGPCMQAKPGMECHKSVIWAMNEGMRTHPEWYAPLTKRSSFEEFQMLLFQSGKGGCMRPCSKLRAQHS